MDKRFTHRGERRLRPAIPARHAEVPVAHIFAGPIPIVGPGVDERPRAPPGERAADLPIQGPRLLVLAVPPAVQTDLAHHHRPLTRQGVQPSEVGLEPLLRLEVHVEADEVQEIELQVLGGRIVDVGDEAVGRFVFGGAIQPLQEALDAAAAEPARDGRGNLVADRITQDRGMVRAGAHAGAHERVEVGCILAFVGEETDVALDGHAHHHPQTVTRGGVQQPARRHGVHAHGIESVRRHARKVPVDGVGLGHFAAVGARAKRPVCHAAEIELLVSDKEKLSPYGRRAFRRAGGGNGRWCDGRRGRRCGGRDDECLIADDV